VTTGLAVVLPAAPFAMALLGLLLPARARALPATLGILGAVVAMAAAIVLAATVSSTVDAGRTWVSFGDIAVTVGVRVDPAVALVAIAVGTVALAVQLYSVSYLHDDDRYAPYAAQVSLFTAAMMLVVVSGDLVLLLVGWEVMGVCSYLLIGHDRRLPEAPAAAVKAFLVTRVGDVGFLLGIVLLGLSAGSFRLADVLAPHVLTPARTTTVCLLLLAGVAGKSAQFPLHTWLPDAMAGPTPISALIHAATMVAAGVYVVARLNPLFAASQVALDVLALMAAVTMVLGALAATAQDDIKRVLAWSTVSQIAYMVGALAIGSSSAALFHLLTHAAFKALLFLGAGCVIHALGTNLMSGMGGVRAVMPVTFWSMTIGLGALAGVPPLAGFWSKDNILDQAVTGIGWRAAVVYVAGLVTVFLTGWYATRLWLRTFFGPYRGGSITVSGAAGHRGLDGPGEAPGAMLVPVVVLAAASVLLGFAGLAPGFSHALDPTDREPIELSFATAAPLTWVALGIAAAWWVWRRRPQLDPARILGLARPVLANAFYLDGLQRALVVRPVLALARLVRRADESLVDGAVEATGRGTLRLGGLVGLLHRAALPRAVSAVLVGSILLGVAAALVGRIP
jgi:NADH-quinone oxidoreductase subunit L